MWREVWGEVSGECGVYKKVLREVCGSVGRDMEKSGGRCGESVE